jgi:hypothetical protein
VETFGFAPWMTARAKRLRLYRFLGNSFWYWLAICLFAGFLNRVIPQLSILVGYAAVPFALLFGVPAIASPLVWWSFQLGLIRCPSCAARFAPRFPPWIPRACQNCHYDIYTLRHRGDF